jgi:hypothetical protein
MKIRFSFIVLSFITLWVSYDLYLSFASVKRSSCTTALIELMGRRVTPRQTLNALYAKVGGHLSDAQCAWSILWNKKNDEIKKSLKRSSLPLVTTQDQIVQDLDVVWNIGSKLIRHPLINLWHRKHKSFDESSIEIINFDQLDLRYTDRIRLAMDRWQRLCFSLDSDPVLTAKEHVIDRHVFYCFPHL